MLIWNAIEQNRTKLGKDMLAVSCKLFVTSSLSLLFTVFRCDLPKNLSKVSCDIIPFNSYPYLSTTKFFLLICFTCTKLGGDAVFYQQVPYISSCFGESWRKNWNGILTAFITFKDYLNLLSRIVSNIRRILFTMIWVI